MTREDIIRMAEECGVPEFENNESQAENIMRFAALVASAERERLTDAAMKAAEKAVDVAMALEREACAKVCEEIYTGEEACGDWPTPEMCATAIRARGQA